MTAYFKTKVIPFLWEHEGTEYENDPDDPGGETRWGVDKRSHPSVDIKNLTESQATEIYWSEWIKYACDHLNQPLDWIFFDACVNCGLSRALKFLNESGRDPKKFQNERRGFYNRLAEQKPVLKKFLKGWLARVDDLSRETGVI
jgi:lysozyme family protein